MRIKYNAPTVLTFTLLCTTVLILSGFFPTLILNWFLVPGRNTFRAGSFRNWVTILTHVAGHANRAHLINNFMLILLIGPMLEENYGSKSLLIMIVTTALVTGVLNVLLFNSALLGASGVVFMMILLSSFTNFNHGEVPLTFILVMILYMGLQLFNTSDPENVSHFAHFVGGLCGSIFGFFRPQRKGSYV
ncbi:MAG: rhomboid family intramembrane serine protease [Treponema sp.]|jgi:membrane associated rhomboid family serine protease|nr:rhomboid family intramembrane serine protease [Treponema sp.]